MQYVIVGIIFCYIAYLIIEKIMQNINDTKAPVINTKAKLLDRSYGYISVKNQKPYLIFELDTGSTIKFTVSESVINDYIDDEWGTLTFQGGKFIKFVNGYGTLG